MILEHLIQDMVAIQTDLLKEKAPDPFSNKGSKYAARVFESYNALRSEIDGVLVELDGQTERMKGDLDYLISDRKYVDKKVVEKLRTDNRTVKEISGLAERLVTAYEGLYGALQLKKEVIPVYEEDFALACKLRAIDGILPKKLNQAKNRVVESKDIYSRLDRELTKVYGEIESLEGEAGLEELEIVDAGDFDASAQIPYMGPDELGMVLVQPKKLGPNDTHPYFSVEAILAGDTDFLA